MVISIETTMYDEYGQPIGRKKLDPNSEFFKKLDEMITKEYLSKYTDGVKTVITITK